MPCVPVIDPSCLTSAVAGAVGGGLLSSVANGVRSALDWMFTNTVILWLKIPDLYPASETASLNAVRHWLFPATAAVAVGGAIAAGARMALTRKHSPLLDLTTGLAVIGLVAALGIVLPTQLMRAADLWTQWVLSESTGGHVTSQLNALLDHGYGTGVPDVAVIVFGTIATVASGIQALLLIFREAAILILAAVLPLAAAGAIAPATRGWIKKTCSWMLALIFYPAAAAAVYATGFTLIGTGTGLRAMLIGFAVIVLSVVALPVLMKFFTWTTGTVTSGGGGAGQFLGLAAAGALGLGALRGGGSAGATSAQQQAQHMQTNNPPPPPASTSGTPGSPGPSGTPGPSGHPGPSGADGAPTSGGIGADQPGSRRTGHADPAAPNGGTHDGGSSGTDPSSAGGTARANTGSRLDGAAGPTPSGSGTSPGAASSAAKGRAAAQSGPAAAGFAALFAAQAMASGAKNAAASAMEPEDKS